MVLLGLMGIKGSGKSTAAAYLVTEYGFQEKSFAECLKRACQELFLLTDEQVFGTQEQKETPDPRWFGCTPRKMLQYVGTDLLREQLDVIMPGLHNNIFTHHFKLWYEEELKKNQKLCVIVSDVRFKNEIDFIQSLGGVVIKLDRLSVQTNDMHASERELLNITTQNYTIDNTGTINELYNELESCMLKAFGLTPIERPCDDYSCYQYMGWAGMGWAGLVLTIATIITKIYTNRL